MAFIVENWNEVMIYRVCSIIYVFINRQSHTMHEVMYAEEVLKKYHIPLPSPRSCVIPNTYLKHISKCAV